MKTQYNESHRMTVTGDLDGRTVAQILEMLAQYPDDAKFESDVDWYRGMDGAEEFEFFKIVWKKKDGSNG
jgi:hypothetical protein